MSRSMNTPILERKFEGLTYSDAGCERRSGTEIGFGQFPKVIAQSSEHQPIVDLVPVLGNNLSHEAPELSARTIANTQRKDDARKSEDIFFLQSASAYPRCTLTRYAAKAVQRTLVILAGTVDISDDGFVAFNQAIGVHLRHKVEHTICVASTMLLDPHEPPFAFQAPPELRVGDRRQQADHRDRDCAFTNEVYLPLEDVIRIIIKADDKAAQHLHPVALHMPYRVD